MHSEEHTGRVVYRSLPSQRSRETMSIVSSVSTSLVSASPVTRKILAPNGQGNLPHRPPVSAGVENVHTLERKPALITPPPAAEAFYSEVLKGMADSGILFLVSGTYALASYTGIDRPTKDVDVFAKAGDALKMLHYFKEHGFEVEIVDERWLYRITRGDLFVDVITNMPTVTTHVTDEWFLGAPDAELFGAKVKLVPPTQLIWSKIFVQDHHRYDMADVAHVILKCHETIDWKQLLSHMELYWEVLLIALLNFRFVYPSERNVIPKWLIDELLERLRDQSDVKGPGKKVCRGRIFSPRDYAIDVDRWGFSEAVGNLEEQYGE